MVDFKLVDYVKRHVAKGYSKEEIINILKKNGWDKKNIEEAFRFIDTKRSAPQDLQPAKVSEESLSQTKQQYLSTLRSFIINARNKGVSDIQIKNALLAKKWPLDLVEEGFRQVPVQQQRVVKETVKEKPKIKPHREPFDYRKLIWYILGFIIAAAIIAGTIFVYYYVIGLSQYTIVINGEEQHGKCLELDCSDMKDVAFGYAKDNLTMMLIIGAIVAFVTVTLYAFLPVRNAVLWIVNILYFLFLIFIGVRWVLFNRSI